MIAIDLLGSISWIYDSDPLILCILIGLSTSSSVDVVGKFSFKKVKWLTSISAICLIFFSNLNIIKSYNGFFFFKSQIDWLLWNKRGAFLRDWIMNCFSCCVEDDMHKAADNGNLYMAKNLAGNIVVLTTWRMMIYLSGIIELGFLLTFLLVGGLHW